jgi:TnpA family transposase
VRLGPVQTAAHVGGRGEGVVTEHQLSLINQSHITAPKLEAANTALINAYSRFALPKVWGNPRIAAADGTKIELPQGSLFSQYHGRYHHVGGIAYHHISDTYVALFTHFIACGIWEAVYIIDGLLKNESLIQPDTLHSDTQGQTTVVFGLAHLLGIKLMPRIRNWQDLVFYRSDKEERYIHLEAIFRETIDWSVLQTHWQDLMRVVLSIKAGKILPSTLLRKLGNYSRKNRLYQAFGELGRVIRTIYLLNSLESLPLRQQVTSSTNKVEKYNQFTDWITFGGEALLLVYDGEERDKRVKYTDLIANAIMLQNVVELTRALKELKAEGLEFTKEEVSHLSPYLTRHIRRFGEYVIDLEKIPDPLSEEVVSLDL